MASIFKAGNARFRALELNSDLKRLYASSLECQLFIFNVSNATPIVMKSFTFGQEFGYVKHIIREDTSVQGG